MKKLILFFVIIICCTGCSGNMYTMKKPQEDIKKIEIGISTSQGNLRLFETKKELSKQEILVTKQG